MEPFETIDMMSSLAAAPTPPLLSPTHSQKLDFVKFIRHYAFQNVISRTRAPECALSRTRQLPRRPKSPPARTRPSSMDGHDQHHEFIIHSSDVERIWHIRQSRPDSGLGFQVKVLDGVPSSLGSGLTAGVERSCPFDRRHTSPPPWPRNIST